MNTRKNILIVTPEIPYPVFKGNQNRIDQTIRLLSSLGHNISIAVLNSNQVERKSKDVKLELEKAYDNIQDIIVRKHPKFANRTSSRFISFIDKKIFGADRICTQITCPNKFRTTVKKYINVHKPDVVIVNYLKIADVIPLQYKGLTIIDTHDFATNIVKQGLQLKPNKNLNINKFEASEKKWIRKFNIAIAINPREQEEFQKRFELQNCYTIPSFHNIEDIGQGSQNHKYDILFVGSSSPFNIEGFLKFNAKSIPVLRRILGREPQVAIVGDVCNAQAIKNLNGAYLHKLGRIPDLQSVYNESKIVICPLLSGAGMKIKVVEALSYGKAIVTTSVGADGINIIHKHDAYISDDWNEFSQSIKDILTNDSLREKLEKNSKKLAMSDYSYQAVSCKWGELISNGKITYSNNNKTEQIIEKVNSEKKEIALPALKRKKCLIFGMDARTLMDFNLDIAIHFKKLGVYSEVLKMEPEHKNYFMQHGFITHSMRQLITKEHKEIAKKWYNLNKSTELHNLYYKDVNIGMEIQTHKAMFPQHFQNESYAKSIIHTVVLIEVLLDLSKKIKPDFFVGWNGDGPHMIYVPKIVATILNKPILFVERGLLPDSYVIDSQGVNFKSNIAGSYTPLLTKERYDRAEAYIEKFINSNSSIVNLNQKIIDNKNDIIALLKLNKNGYIFFPEQIEGDSNIILNSPRFKNMTDVANELLISAKSLNLSLVIRQHPENKNNNIKYPKDVIICNDIHIHSLLRNSEFNVTINSTTGLESLLLKKPTFVLGNSIYSGKGFTFDVRNSEEIVNKYITYFSSEEILQKQRNLFYAFLSYLLSDYLIFNDKSGSNDHLKIFNSLLHKIGLGERLKTIPAQTKACTYFINQRNLLQEIVSKGLKVNLINAIHPDTKLYMTGPNRPLFNIDKIKTVINEEQILGIVNCNERHILEKINEFTNTDTYIIVIVSSKEKVDAIKNKYKSTRLFVMDEYFLPQ
ncbi:TPA: glycosyltransferase [Escherichia coli]|uniref:capsular polysaccharide export protein, LipB/KpsS family n=1 Tax=Escherichia coli TaxID=562 RepID=UPI0019A45DC6|nr:glycosyltransferase [Escherichia coli]EIJ6694540.1 glycosyltransferase [Escherichia coli]HAM4117252.1 glycosyltransferase [Escherichia coli]HAY4404782.1 glycosyltransferase [Escherichia coli]